MEGVLRIVEMFLKPKPKINEAEIMKQEITEELNRISQKIKEVEDLFDLTYDPDMTEAYVYELRALNVRYNCVLKRARQLGVSAEAYPGCQTI